MSESATADTRFSKPALLPLFPFAGSKRSLAASIIQHFPTSYHAYCEPFGGGLSVFGAISSAYYTSCMVSDGDADLVQLWRVAASSGQDVLTQARAEANDIEGSPPAYYAARSVFNSGTVTTRSAGLQLCLRCNTFNGLWRRGPHGMNVPPTANIGAARLPDADRVIAWQVKLAQAAIRCWNIRDYAAWMTGKGPEDAVTRWVREVGSPCVVYLDPPYCQKFAGYLAEGFGEDDQRWTLRLACTLSDAGHFVAWSNSNTAKTRQLLKEEWPTGRIVKLDVQRTIAADKIARGLETELLVCT